MFLSQEQALCVNSCYSLSLSRYAGIDEVESLSNLGSPRALYHSNSPLV